MMVEIVPFFLYCNPAIYPVLTITQKDCISPSESHLKAQGFSERQSMHSHKPNGSIFVPLTRIRYVSFVLGEGFHEQLLGPPSFSS